MAYLQFPTQEDTLKAFGMRAQLAGNTDNPCFMPIISDPQYGLVYVVPAASLSLLEQAGIPYTTIPKESITTPYVEHLRQRFPELGDEL